MKITTWNVNSIRTRRERALAWLEAHQPDVLALQETKVEDAVFPEDDFAQRGYHVARHGQKTYNGVALLTRNPAAEVRTALPHDPDPAEARMISARVGDLTVIDVYVPNGKHITSDKFAYKMDWLTRLLEHLETHHEPTDPLVLLGDFNITPDDRDVHDPVAWRGKVHCHPVERAMLQRFFDWGFTDLLRHKTEEEGIYSWWDYRGGGFPRNKGLRIDLILGTVPLLDRVVSVEVDRHERAEDAGEGKPSDHAPVTLTLADA